MNQQKDEEEITWNKTLLNSKHVKIKLALLYVSFLNGMLYISVSYWLKGEQSSLKQLLEDQNIEKLEL